MGYCFEGGEGGILSKTVHLLRLAGIILKGM